jgi:hypothetical protein
MFDETLITDRGLAAENGLRLDRYEDRCAAIRWSEAIRGGLDEHP